ncbi:hypothetical protein VKS41_003047 [Umbelopsis sp. WA50703]
MPNGEAILDGSTMADNESSTPSRPSSPVQNFNESEQQPDSFANTTGHQNYDMPRSGEKAVENLRNRIGGLSINQGKTHPLLSTNDILWSSNFTISGGSVEPPLPSYYSGVLDMPTRTIQEHLIEIYFRRHCQILPLFSRQIFFRHLSEKGYLLSPLVLNAMYAHACTYEHDLQEHADIFFDRARSLVEDFLDVPRISTIFALLLIATYEVQLGEDKNIKRSCRPSIYAGMATSMCLQMRLQSQVYQTHLTEFDKELRKRAFWSCYNLDKEISLASQRPAILSRKGVSITLPTISPTDEDPVAIDAFIWSTRLMIICEKFLDLQSSGIGEPSYMLYEDNTTGLLEDLSNWLTSLPKSLIWTPLPEISSPVPAKPPQTAVIATLHLHYNVLEHRILKSSTNQTSKSIHRRIRTVANTITQLAHFLVNDAALLANYDHCAYAVLLAALTHAADLRHSTPQVSLQSEVQLRRSVAIIDFLLENRALTGSGGFSSLIGNLIDVSEVEDIRSLSAHQMYEKTKMYLENLIQGSSRLQPQGLERLQYTKPTVLQHFVENDLRQSAGSQTTGGSLPPIEAAKLLEPAHYTFELISVEDNWGYPAARVPASVRTLDHQRPDPVTGAGQNHLSVQNSTNAMHDPASLMDRRHVTPPPVLRHYSPPEMDTPPPDPRTLWAQSPNNLRPNSASEDTILYSIAASATGWVDDSEKWAGGHQSQSTLPISSSVPQASLPATNTIPLDMGVQTSSKYLLPNRELGSVPPSVVLSNGSASQLLPDQHSHALIDHMHVDNFT